MNFLRITTTLFILCVLLSVLDIFRNPNLVENVLTISSAEILGIVFLCFVVLRLKFGKIIPNILAHLNLYCGFSILILSSVLAVIGWFGGANFIYSKTLLNLDRLFILGTFLISTGIISQQNKVLAKLHKGIIMVIGILFPLLLFFVSLLPLYFFDQVVKEGGLIENFQAIVLLIGAIYSFLLANKLLKKKHLSSSLIFFILAILFFLTCMDEVAWGQQFFNMKTPGFIAMHNDQNEITIHNTKSISGFVPYIYIVIGLYGSLSWICVKKRLLSPRRFLMPYFLLPALYNLIAFFNIPRFGVWSEPAELMLYAGVVFHILCLYYIKEKVGF